MAELASRRFVLQEALVWCHTHSKCSRNVSDCYSMSCQYSTTYPAPKCRCFPSIVPSSPPYNILSLIPRICKVKHSLQCPCVLELSCDFCSVLQCFCRFLQFCSDSYPCLSNLMGGGAFVRIIASGMRHWGEIQALESLR